MVKENPFEKILDIMQEEGAKRNTPPIFIAKITSQFPDLKIKINDITITKNNILISENLISNFQEKEELTGTISFNYASASAGTTDTGIVTSLNILNANYKSDVVKKKTDNLKIGDLVVVMATEDMQTFIILNKVVRI